MKIKLTTNIGVVGKKGEVVKVGTNLGIGLVKRGQAVYHNPKTEVTNKDSKKPEYIKTLDNMTVKELQDVAKQKDVSYAGLKKAELLKELKENISTKEDKAEYKTK